MILYLYICRCHIVVHWKAIWCKNWEFKVGLTRMFPYSDVAFLLLFPLWLFILSRSCLWLLCPVMEVSAGYAFDQCVVFNASSIGTAAALIVPWNSNYKTIYHISSAMRSDNAYDVVFALWRSALICTSVLYCTSYSQQVMWYWWLDWFCPCPI